MKILTSFLFLLILSLFSGCSDQKRGTYVEALNYRDGRPVIIEIVDGKIGRIEYRAPISVAPEIYVAPGLIDIQVNGYMGVDFSDQDLTIGQMQEATKA